MRDPFAREFYSSHAWRVCRTEYAKSVGNLCEICMKRGEITPAVEVHHKIRLTPQNISDPSVTLGWNNLQALCERCHADAHKLKRRYRIAADGRLVIPDSPL